MWRKTKLPSRNHDLGHGHFHIYMWCNMIGIWKDCCGVPYYVTFFMKLEMELIIIVIEKAHHILNQVQIRLSDRRLGKQNSRSLRKRRKDINL